eukprot:jgi/Psemu1/284729/fgenesh1_pg.62_\
MPSPSPSPSPEDQEPHSPRPGGPNGDGSEDSPSWSFSSLFSSPSSLRERFQEFDDQQRIQRLSACQQLDAILSDCRERHANNNNNNNNNKHRNHPNNDPIESVSIGLRNMKYFGWRGIATTPSDQNDDNNNDSNNDELSSLVRSRIRSSCSREQHAVWACRAVATGCGKDLAELKRCFDHDDDGAASASASAPNQTHHHRVLLTNPYTNYEGFFENGGGSGGSGSGDGDGVLPRIPCGDVQRKLGSCVTAGGRELLERKQQRERPRDPQR